MMQMRMRMGPEGDLDGDGIPNCEDVDDDGDGINDTADEYPHDHDNDGIPDRRDDDYVGNISARGPMRSDGECPHRGSRGGNGHGGQGLHGRPRGNGADGHRSRMSGGLGGIGDWFRAWFQ